MAKESLSPEKNLTKTNKKSDGVLTKKPDASVTKKRARKFAFMIFIIALLAGLVAGSYGYVKAYEGKIFPKVTIAGLQVGGKTPSEAEMIVNDYVNQLNLKGPTINYESQAFYPKLSDLGVNFDVKGVVSEAYNFGRQGSLSNRIQENTQLALKAHEIPLSPSIKEDVLNSYLGSFVQTVEIAPQNAGLQISNGTVTSSPSKDGRGIDKNKLKNDILNLISQDVMTGKITLVTSNLKPQINDKGVLEAKAAAERYMGAAPLNFSFEDQSFSADRQEIGSWISFKEDGTKLKAEISLSKLDGYLNWIASKIDIPTSDREIEYGSGNILSEGSDGRGTNTQALKDEISIRLASGVPGAPIAITTYPIARDEKMVYPSFEPGKFAGRYIDINLSEQMLRLIDGQTLIGEYQVSTGKWSMPTPEGVRYIESKTEMAWSSKYGLYMPWWNSIGGGYGIHELPEWPGGYKEGEGHLGTPVSHGCIRLGVGPAETVYNWAPIGTPVYIHK